MQSDKPMSLNKTFHDRRRSSPRATVLAINIDLIFIHTIFPKGWLVVKRATFFIVARHAGVPQWSNVAVGRVCQNAMWVSKESQNASGNGC